MNLRKIALPVMAVATMGLVACGENGTTETIVEKGGMDIVASAADLPKCTADNAGEQAIVKSDGLVRYCYDGAWKVLGGSGATAADYGCETKPLADDRGVAIYCGGDSIGVVLNGAKGDKGDAGEQGIQGERGETGAQGIQGEQGVAGADGKDGLNGTDGKDGAAGKDGADGVGCKVVGQTAESVTIQCGDDKFSMNLNGGRGDIIVDEPEVSLEKLNGVSQKGPYINGASVTLFELDGSKSLMQTGRTFGGEIISDDGRFSVNNVTLNSSYVRLTANGYYRNEISGENTTSALTLYAYSDLKRRTSVNINLLTHLEYYRVGYLMENSDGSLTITAAKKMAQKEIFDQFHIVNTNFESSEDLDVFGSSEGDAALLAISVLLQGSRNVTELTSLLSDFGTKIEEKGEWNDPVTRAKIADWADSVDLGLKGGLTLPKIESNVSGWGLGTVPAFQKYVRNFWYKEYGLGDCDETRKNEVVRDTNSKSAYYASTYAYAGPNDKKVRFICDEKSKLWRRATDIEKDTLGWGHDFKTGDVRNGRVNTNLVYVYEEGNWRHGTVIDSLMYMQKADGGKACIKSALGDTSAVKANYRYMVCSDGTQDTAYQWKDVAGVFYNDTYEARSECSATGKYNDGTILSGRVNSVNKYVCDADEFREATALEKTINQGCASYMVEKNIVNKIHAISDYECSSGGWVIHKESMEYAGITYKTVRIGAKIWMAENLNYDLGDVSDLGDYAWHGCYGNISDNCEKYGRLYTRDAVENYVQCDEKKCRYGVCPEGWHFPSIEELKLLEGVVAGPVEKAMRVTSWSNGSDTFGLSALPAGCRSNSGGFEGLGSETYWWTAWDSRDNMAFSWFLTSNNAYPDSYKGDSYYDRNKAYSVRCLKDSD